VVRPCRLRMPAITLSGNEPRAGAPARSCPHRCGRGRLQGGDEGPGDGLVDLDAADIEAIDAAALDQDLARAMMAGCGVAAAIVGMQAAPAMAATGEPLQEGAALSHGATRPVRSGPRVLWARPKIIESTFDRVRYGFTTEFFHTILWW
jgi:hypothetical protein